jgi:hypothetical protein
MARQRPKNESCRGRVLLPAPRSGLSERTSPLLPRTYGHRADRRRGGSALLLVRGACILFVPLRTLFRLTPGVGPHGANRPGYRHRIGRKSRFFPLPPPRTLRPESPPFGPLRSTLLRSPILQAPFNRLAVPPLAGSGRFGVPRSSLPPSAGAFRVPNRGGERGAELTCSGILPDDWAWHPCQAPGTRRP